MPLCKDGTQASRFKARCFTASAVSYLQEGQPKFLQVYFLDSFAQQTEIRGQNRRLNQQLLGNLTEWFQDNNHVQQLKTAKDIIEEDNTEERKIGRGQEALGSA